MKPVTSFRAAASEVFLYCSCNYTDVLTENIFSITFFWNVCWILLEFTENNHCDIARCIHINTTSSHTRISRSHEHYAGFIMLKLTLIERSFPISKPLLKMCTKKILQLHLKANKFGPEHKMEDVWQSHDPRSSSCKGQYKQAPNNDHSCKWLERAVAPFWSWKTPGSHNVVMCTSLHETLE